MSLSIAINKARELVVTIPSPSGKERSVLIPITTAGCKVLRTLLSEREEQKLSDMTIGSRASPTQDMIDAWLRAEVRKEEVEKILPKPVSEKFEKLGLGEIVLDL